jgi:ABC-2 type transport system ATP-binding protein
VDVELRQGLWEFVRQLNTAGHTIVLTTHYLEEAETLCSRVAMLKNGRVVALDTTRNLLAGVSGIHLKLKLDPDRLPVGLAERSMPAPEGYRVLPIQSHDETPDIMIALRQDGIAVQELELLQPDLEEAFVQIMGRR